MFGPAPTLDFDGTISELSIDWKTLRERLMVSSIDELWLRDRSAWEQVTMAELDAADHSAPRLKVTDRLFSVRAFAVLTSNSSESVYRFLERFPPLNSRLVLVIGRDQLGGPKTDFDRFRSGVELCVKATSEYLDEETPVYVGDQLYELEFARRLGLDVVNVNEIADLSASRRPLSKGDHHE